MAEVIINKQATINAEGTHNTKGNKSVVCLTTREVFVSGLDASLKCNVSRSEISRCCRGQKTTAKGMRFCFLSDIATHLDEIFEADRVLAEKAAAYDEITARERAAKEVEEKYKADLAAAEEQYTHADTLYDKLATKLIEAQRKREEAYATLTLLREAGAQYAI